MSYWLLCTLVFLMAYGLNLLYVSVFYHRGLTHASIALHPRLRKFVVRTGNWVTGLDPKGWACMHRLHHLHSDTLKDPHSPLNSGTFGLAYRQLRSYRHVLTCLQAGKPSHAELVKDLDFPVNWLNRRGLWYLPYALHAAVAALAGLCFGAWTVGAAYWIGMMSHPVQGWMVNSLAHQFGYRNFPTPDNARNNTAVAWLVFGEGFQNNHHHQPQNPNFAARWGEWDAGYLLCRVLRAFRLVTF